jgi:hypothetical protein
MSGQAARWVALAFGGLGVACMLLAVAAVTLRPRTFTTHREAIGYQLAERGIGYQSIAINRQWPDTLTNEYYGANLQITLAAGRTLPGRLQCRVKRTHCTFNVVALGIVQQPLPELVEATDAPWLDQLVAFAQQTGLR